MSAPSVNGSPSPNFSILSTDFSDKKVEINQTGSITVTDKKTGVVKNFEVNVQLDGVKDTVEIVKYILEQNKDAIEAAVLRMDAENMTEITFSADKIVGRTGNATQKDLTNYRPLGKIMFFIRRMFSPSSTKTEPSQPPTQSQTQTVGAQNEQAGNLTRARNARKGIESFVREQEEVGGKEKATTKKRTQSDGDQTEVDPSLFRSDSQTDTDALKAPTRKRNDEETPS